MPQKLVQREQQKEELKTIQAQRLTQQQMLAVKLLEMPLTELEQSVQAEIDDNPAMEAVSPDAPDVAHDCGDEAETGQTEDADSSEAEERQSALDEALSNIGMDDRMNDSDSSSFFNAQADNDADYEETVYGEQTSFYDSLKAQMVDVELTDEERDIMEYVIGSLDGDGLLRKSADSICDELVIYHNIDCTEADVEKIIKVLQSFDPAGIGAGSLQECLLLQIERRPQTKMRQLMEEVIEKHFDEFMNKHWDKIVRQMGMNETIAESVRSELLRLNPKPGASLGETEGRNMQQITPDFIVDTADDGTITFSVSGGNIPELYVSSSFTELLRGYKENKSSMSRRDKEALLYAKDKVERAKGFIDAIKQRRHTLYITMKAIIEIQRKFFLDGDESDIQPMILKDVADRTGLDISTVSRVSNMKYAQTRWGTFKLRHFFSDSVKTDSGEEMSTRKIKLAMKDLIDGEDKNKPLSDDALTKILTQKGYPIARRTIAKYREQLGIPVARLRKK